MDDRGERRLIGAIILQCLRDLFHPDWREEALQFLHSDACRVLLSIIGLHPDWIYRHLPFLLRPRYWPCHFGRSVDSERKKRRQKVQRLRAQGLSTDRRPLARTCLNCVEIRSRSDYLICAEGRTTPGTRAQMRKRQGCEVWELRYEIDIKLSEGNSDE